MTSSIVRILSHFSWRDLLGLAVLVAAMRLLASQLNERATREWKLQTNGSQMFVPYREQLITVAPLKLRPAVVIMGDAKDAACRTVLARAVDSAGASVYVVNPRGFTVSVCVADGRSTPAESVSLASPNVVSTFREGLVTLAIVDGRGRAVATLRTALSSDTVAVLDILKNIENSLSLRTLETR